MDVKFICYRCGQTGHKSTYCQEDQLPPEELNMIIDQNPENMANISRVVCNHCHQKGHYANNCPQKLQRTANNMSGQDKPFMSTEQRIAHQVDRLKNEGQMPRKFMAATDYNDGQAAESNFN